MHTLSQSSSQSGSSSQQFREQSRPLLPHYPKKRQGSRERSFQSSWYKVFSWLEYFKDVDSCFCYPCQMFAKDSTKEKTFITNGFSNWKTAMESGKGFKKHEQSEVHMRAVASWKEKEFREKRGQTVRNLIQVKPEHKIWLKTVFNTTKYLVANGLSFRGHEENSNLEEGPSGGLYLNTFTDLIFPQDPHLQQIAKNLPTNAKYTSPEIQNDVIETLAEIVRETVANECKEAELFTLMMDGTTDSCQSEMEGVALRYWNKSKGGIVEHVVDVKLAEDRSAKGLLDIATTTLEDKHGISMDGLVSNTFDGASVMSGTKGGLQQLIQEHCGRNIPYIHCLNHRLALVIKSTLSNILEMDDFFQLNQDLYIFFRISQIHKLYEGDSLKKLITTRWDGHLSSLKVISKCIDDVHATLEKCSVSKSVDSEYRSKAKGYLSALKQPVNIFLIPFMMDVLSLLDILNKTFQKPDCDLQTSLIILKSIREKLNSLRHEYTIDKIANVIYPECAAMTEIEPGVASKRKRTTPERLQDSVITDKLPIFRDMNNNVEGLRALAVEVLDNLEAEFKNRFSEFNTDLFGCPSQSWNHQMPSFLMLMNLGLFWTLSKPFQ
ncbi:zinc finger MYM-type protein 1-like [Dendronephthya gigantea]|uniref:zinc finger MYM-type protein 1-like n=1 Tax=Dendronephthya gigantea TaxID=151771 RepID=UPI00106CB7AC|nr:zinc finger MYM-type protein 1-like [Dendronephthya gigantea]